MLPAVTFARGICRKCGTESDNGKWQKEKAIKLVNSARVVIPETGCGIPEIKLFEEYYACLDVAIIVYRFARGEKPIHDGSEYVHNLDNTVRHTLRIMYYDGSRHYQPILNLNHRCPNKCRSCLMQKPPCERDQTDRHVVCPHCNRIIFSQMCLSNHLKPGSFDKNHTVCASLKICTSCCKTIRTPSNDTNSHICDTVFCKLMQPIGHLSFIPPIPETRQQAATSGYPPECRNNDEQAIDRYTQNFKQEEGIKLDKRQLADELAGYGTDSIVYVSRGNGCEYYPSTRPFLGQLADELAGYGPDNICILGTYIKSFDSGRPKFYAYKYQTPGGRESCICKIKGIRLNASASEKISF
ncbi:hypothetical protein TSAR_016850 [Trichomalopsis sarcophagae]|uniref:Uncharacterized protein n=1 Tax=Trichomalopsis sarcophagae TaxID=543379 RepID=A0A232EHG8_9HYME|nr:hypothetical protein TSAR_016850 [Trichomalopsis sarcophagae]